MAGRVSVWLTSTHVHSGTRAIGRSRPLMSTHEQSGNHVHSGAPPPPPPVLAGCGGGRGRGGAGLRAFMSTHARSGNRAITSTHVHSCPLGQSGAPPTAPRPSIFWVGVWARLLCAMGNVDVPRTVKTAAFDGREPGRATSTRLPRTAIPSPTLPHPVGLHPMACARRCAPKAWIPLSRASTPGGLLCRAALRSGRLFSRRFFGRCGQRPDARHQPVRVIQPSLHALQRRPRHS